MGPRPCGRGRVTLNTGKGGVDALQWGHGLAAVDGAVRPASKARSARLQWGHGLAAVDGTIGRRMT